MSISIRTRAVGPYHMSAAVLICNQTQHSVLIDPGADPDALKAMLTGTQLQAILVTHGHGDHVDALDEMRTAYHVPVYAHPGPHVGTYVRDMAPLVDHPVQNGEIIRFGNQQLQVVYTPGHCSDGVCYVAQNQPLAIVGDVIFAGGPGKTFNADGFQISLRTLKNIVLAWPDDTLCYPGHGPSFRLGDLRRIVSAFVAHNHGTFFGDAEWGN